MEQQKQSCQQRDINCTSIKELYQSSLERELQKIMLSYDVEMEHNNIKGFVKKITTDVLGTQEKRKQKTIMLVYRSRTVSKR